MVAAPQRLGNGADNSPCRIPICCCRRSFRRLELAQDNIDRPITDAHPYCHGWIHMCPPDTFIPTIVLNSFQELYGIKEDYTRVNVLMQSGPNIEASMFNKLDRGGLLAIMVHCCPWALPLLLLFCSQTLTSLALASPNYYPPKPGTSYSLTHALTGHGAPGIFDSSTTPDGDYGVYNWCNMPHARKREYM